MEFLIILTIKSTLVILLTVVLLVALKRNSATLRHWVISLTMIGLLGLPLFIEVLPSVTVEVPYLAKQTIQKKDPVPHHPIKKKRIVKPAVPTHTKMGTHTEVTKSTEDTPPAINNNVFSRQETVYNKPEEVIPTSIPTITLPTLLGFIWLMGCAFFFIKFLLGIYHIWAITRKSYPFPIPNNLQLSTLPKLRQDVQFLVNSTIKTPMTWGAFRPVVLLPTAALDWSNSELQAVLVHELSHIKKKDYWIHTIGLLAVCLYWYNPLIWWMKKQQLLEREKACDEAVLLSGVQQQNYAEQLIQITRRLSQRSSIIGENALPMAKVSQIKKRVIAILNFENSQFQFSTGKQWQWGLFYACLLPILAILTPIGQRVIQEHFPLLPLETVTQYLETKQLSTVISPAIFPTKNVATIIDTQAVDNLPIVSDELNESTPNYELIAPQVLQPIPPSLISSSLPSIIPINTNNIQSQHSTPTNLSNQQKTGEPTLQEQIHARLVNLNQVTENNENFAGYEGLKEAIGDAEIVMLGEQSHGEATTFQTKIKLIKYLHQEMGFDILAFESSVYECDRAWSMVEEGQNVKNTIGKSIFTVWSAIQEINPLYDYIEKQLESERPLRVAGFDHQMTGKIGVDHFVADLTSYIHTFKDAAVYQHQLEELQTILSLARFGKLISFKKKRAAASIAFLKELQELINAKPSDEQSSIWLPTIKSLELFISDMKLGTDTREQQMANNLVWLKEKYPNKKIICWGATSHFLYNSSEIRMDKLVPQVLAANYYKKYSMMGDYLKEKYGDKVYTIGFTAYAGKTYTRSLKSPPVNSVEYLIGNADANNYFLPLKGLSLDNYMSRPLGNLYMTTDIAKVMDGIIFNRHMKSPYTDWDFYMYLVPENKYIPKKLDRLKEYQRKSKLKESE